MRRQQNTGCVNHDGLPDIFGLKLFLRENEWQGENDNASQHHFGWNACSSALSPLTGHAFLERRYLIIPGIRSSRIYVIDCKKPKKPVIHKISNRKKYLTTLDIPDLIRSIVGRKAFTSPP